jgi:membrane dipeptidase
LLLLAVLPACARNIGIDSHIDTAQRVLIDHADPTPRSTAGHADQIALALRAADVERITKSGRIAAILTAEGGHQIDNDLAVLRIYYRMGIRSMTLTHFRNTDWADYSTGQAAHNGLADFGKDVVREMNRLAASGESQPRCENGV